MPSRKEILKKAYDKLEDVSIELTSVWNSIDYSEIDEPGGITQEDYDEFEKMLNYINNGLDYLFYYANEWNPGE